MQTFASAMGSGFTSTRPGEEVFWWAVSTSTSSRALKGDLDDSDDDGDGGDDDLCEDGDDDEDGYSQGSAGTAESKSPVWRKISKESSAVIGRHLSQYRWALLVEEIESEIQVRAFVHKDIWKHAAKWCWRPILLQMANGM